ncbi:SGNH/GDSL hydrolase family protein [Anditalea andensis]|uniref:SGNH hydrolase-type esterase domain-containing protein n=1 Tax=Anditalea andensis TaxID=1048983 RepID=A0A074L0Z9_9BACT|nr:SGNH/GDSL hydrolase family protein [Anditalea andensis]KEO73528.1 hypothetical protein EL17_11530 [Anditalea andensis]
MIKRFIPLSLMLLLFSCKQEPDFLPVKEVSRVLILGNSITHHLPAPEIGWYGNWGMAASAADRDYVAILSDSLRNNYPEVEVTIKTMVDFETGFWEYDYDKLAEIDGIDPDILIWRLAENITQTDFNTFDLEGPVARVVSLIENKPQMRVIMTTSFWGPETVNNELKKIASKNNWELVDLYPLAFASKYRAIGYFENESVAIHPGDLGMLEIANRIFAQIKNCHGCRR